MPVLKKKSKQIQPARLMLLGFSAIILLGTILLCMPFSSTDGKFGSFLDCLFTATSATCVTGITVFDTYRHFTYFGQGVILMLIQVGGLGFLTFVTFFNLMLGKKLGWSVVKIAASDFTDSALASTKRLFYEIVLYSFALELGGALILMFVFVPQFGGYGVFMSIFMAISAFCNAGFDVLTITDGAVGVSNYTDNPVVIITLMLLIIIGGLGFIVWQNIRHYKATKRLLLHTKVVLVTTAVLIFGGGLFFFLAEFNNPETLGDMPVWEKITTSLFMSVSSRTAGFPCFDLHGLNPVSKMFMTGLMFIGAAPASTGGGIKVTTIAIIIATVISVLKGNKDTQIMGHRLKTDAILKTIAVTVLSFALVVLSFSVITFCSEDLSLQDTIFEVVSAFSTTGYSMGISEGMNVISKLIMILTMLAGRVGPVTLMLSLIIRTSKSSNNKILPEGDILVG